MRVYIGGDSLAASFGQNLADSLGDSGKIKATWDSRPSSGLINTEFFDWNKQARNIQSSYNPEIIFFIIGTNDASIVKANPSGYQSIYMEKLKAVSKAFAPSGQKIFFVLAPNMKDKTLDSSLTKLNNVIIEFANQNAYQTIKTSDVLSPANVFVGVFQNKIIRADDGVHITGDGGKLISQYILLKLKNFIDLSNPDNDPALASSKVQGCCVTPKTSVNNYISKTSSTQSNSSSSSSSSSTSSTSSSSSTSTPNSEVNEESN